jgi:predicted metal-dependent HD superfamily phosphohydrolase
MASHRVLLELTRRYSEPHRHYHGIEHIAWLLRTGRDLTLSEDQLLAIWFHDAVYDIPTGDNERASARLARLMLEAERYPQSGIAVVESIVLDTKAHWPTSEPARLVVDLDLAPLGVPWPEFVANAARIEREHAHMPRPEFERARHRFFEEFLARDRIYWTDWGEQFERAARANLERALHHGLDCLH